MICKLPYFEKGDRIYLDEYPEVVHEIVGVYEEDFGFEYAVLCNGLRFYIPEKEVMDKYTLIDKAEY